MINLTTFTLILVGLTACGNNQYLVANPSQAQSASKTTMNHANMHHSQTAQSNQNTAPHTQAYLTIMNQMGDKMSVAGKLADPDVAFAFGMIPHHIGAVEMAKVQLEHGKDETMKKLAGAIIDGQQAEIDLMNGWLNGKDTTTQKADAPHAKAYANNHTHHEMMSAIYDHNPDIAFAKAMIPHHIGAVEMAKVQLEHGKDETMKKLANQIINTQEPEIKLMENWLKSQGQ